MAVTLFLVTKTLWTASGSASIHHVHTAQWGELIFVIFHDLDGCRYFYRDVKQIAANRGRSPDTLKVAPAIYVIVRETETIAWGKRDLIAGMANPVDSLTLLSEVFNYDFSCHGLDEPLSAEVLSSFTGLRGFLDRVVNLSGKKNPTVREFLQQQRPWNHLVSYPCSWARQS